jgi:putative acetyltransferase
MQIRLDDLRGPEIAALLQQHLRDMYATSPAESVHALDLDQLRKSDISFWTLWDEDQLAGCGALKQLSATHGEVKSMRTSAGCQRRGVASRLLQHLVVEAQRRGYQQLSLETGSMDYFAAARALYRKFGFVECGPFAGYIEDPCSVFMTLQLQDIPSVTALRPPA